jgi:hypothetical protein
VVTGVAAAPTTLTTPALEAGGAGLVLLAMALTRAPSALVLALVLVAGPWGLALAQGGHSAAAVAVGAGLLLTGELAGWSQDRRTIVPEVGGDTARLALRTVGGVAAGVVASVVLLALAALPAPGSLLRLVAGLAAVLALVAFVALRRWEP